MGSYRTIERMGEGKVTVKMSRFLSFAVPVDTLEEAKSVVARYTNEYHDARHVCWAYMIGADRATWQLNDNGEPSGTAGRPILGQINSLGLTNVVVVVVRYFGGIKLGTPGLIAAYREAAREALEAAPAVEREETEEIELTFGYMQINEVMTLVKTTPQAVVIEQEFDNTCRMRLLLPKSEVSKFDAYCR